ncbi:hypothetical protein LZ30DRAFT_739633 [Colletotrichum cereale]|nr:hypothetical protein LZ30DRAFT_739633 [Colletotrichum cereale]
MFPYPENRYPFSREMHNAGRPGLFVNACMSHLPKPICVYSSLNVKDNVIDVFQRWRPFATSRPSQLQPSSGIEIKYQPWQCPSCGEARDLSSGNSRYRDPTIGTVLTAARQAPTEVGLSRRRLWALLLPGRSGVDSTSRSTTGLRALRGPMVAGRSVGLPELLGEGP